MDYLKQYRSFISSHYVGEGVRITVGVLVPVLIMGYFDLLTIGLAMGLGALCVSITDNPGRSIIAGMDCWFVHFSYL
jgi:uncharacterized membrane protein YccC